MNEEVRLVVPASPTYLELAIDTAATLAARCHYPPEDIQAVRSAVADAFLRHLGEDGREGAGTVAVCYRVDPDALAGRTDGPPALEISVEPV